MRLTDSPLGFWLISWGISHAWLSDARFRIFFCVGAAPIS
jgi:hypothetical protein